MLPIPSVLSALVKTSVKINGLVIPGRQIAKNLQRFCRPVCFYNEGTNYELSWAGSSFLFKHRSHNLAAFTRHQLGTRPPNECCIIIDRSEGGRVAVTPSEATNIIYGADLGFAEDIQFVEYKSNTGRDLAGLFADIALEGLPDLRVVPKEQLVVIFAIGYPSDFTKYNFDFDDDFVPHNLEVIHGLSRLILSNDWAVTEGMQFHLRLRQHEKYPETLENLDGFSGSPAFFCFMDPRFGMRLGFAGVVRLGGNGIVHLYEAAQMKRLLDLGWPKAGASVPKTAEEDGSVI